MQIIDRCVRPARDHAPRKLVVTGIDSCEHCPARIHERMQHQVCSLTTRESPGRTFYREIADCVELPEWCPLPDASSTEGAA